MGMSKIEICRDVMQNGYRKVNVKDHNGKNRKVLLDGTTAAVIVSVYERVNSELQKKLESMDWLKLQSVCFKAIK